MRILPQMTDDMIHKYHIQGMTCNSCREKVSLALNRIEEIRDIELELSTGEVQIDMQRHINLSRLQEALSDIGPYSISELPPVPKSSSDQMEEQDASSNLIRLFPLLLVFSYLLGLVFLSQLLTGWNGMKAMQTFMGGFFIAFSFFKFLDIKGFAYAFAGYDPIAKRWLPYGYLYPFIELCLGIAYLIGGNPVMTNLITLCVVIISTIGVAQSLLQNRQIQCACLGTVFRLPMTQLTLTENSVMIVMALGMLMVSW